MEFLNKGKLPGGIITLVCLLSVMGFMGCDLSKKFPPIPEPAKERAALDFTQNDVDDLVSMTQEKIYSPAPAEHGNPPEACDYINFLRFKLKNVSYNPEDSVSSENVDAFLLMVPGILEGANGFEYIARNLIYIAKVYNHLNLEVWAMDRRANCLEDTSAEPYLDNIYYEGTYNGQTYDTLEEKHDAIVDLALGYYYYNEALPDGKTFDGFLKNKDVPYLVDFGLKMNTESMFKIIQTMVPDPEVRRQKVFVGGHSLGGIHTSVFAGWDLDGDPDTLDDAGYMNCAGLFAFDSSVTPSATIADSVLQMLPISTAVYLEDMTEDVYSAAIQGFDDGWMPPLLPFPFFDGEVMAITEFIGYLGDWFPDHEFTAIHQIPMNANVRTTIQLMHSRTLCQFMIQKPSMMDFRYTYEALVGAFFDDNFAPVGMIQASLGFLKGGPVVKKDFPLPEEINETIPELADMLSATIVSKDLFIPADEGVSDSAGKGPLYSWADFDEIGNADDQNFMDIYGKTTYTTTEKEMSDMHDFCRALHIGPSNLVEWYFPFRPVMDMIAATFSYGPKYGLNFLHKDMVGVLPSVEFVGGNGILSTGPLGDLVPQGDYIIPGANHMDPMFMSANTSSHRPNEVIQPLIDFIIANSAD
ncbi:MAG: hypothetical protein KJ737_17410 [Proteobacteria bacterium]|nr:hypothetical protein [Pseudomonadota bacterium]